MYMSAKEAAEKWGISERRVRILCSEGRVDGVIRTSWAWNIPVNTPKPGDGRQLRHMKNHDLRIGGMDFSLLDEQKKAIAKIDDIQRFLPVYKRLVSHFILSAFSADDLMLQAQDIAVLCNNSFVPSMQFESQLLVLNLRTILMRMLVQFGLGPVRSKGHIAMSEMRLSQLYQMLTQGIDDEGFLEYRTIEDELNQKTPTIKAQMETLFVQYERDWLYLHPVVRAIFLYGELLRIRPYGRWDGLVAALVLAQELLSGGFPPALVDAQRKDEFKAAMIMTRSRGNYQNALRMLEQMLLFECHQLLGV